MKNLLILVLLAISFLVFLSLWGFYSAIRPFKIISHNTPKNFGILYEDISFLTKDNVSIHGWFIPSKRKNAKTIILLHGYPADKGDILASRLFLHEHYNLLLFDFRYFGTSGGQYTTIGKDEVLDLLAAVQYLESKGIHEVGIWGFSMGAAVALMAATEAPQIKTMVIESAYARLDWMADDYYQIPLLRYPLTYLTRFFAWIFLGYDLRDVSPVTSVGKLNIPILLIYSKKDTVVPARHGLILEEALRHNPKAKFIWVEDTAHGQPINNYQGIVEQFLDSNFK